MAAIGVIGAAYAALKMREEWLTARSANTATLGIFAPRMLGRQQ